MAVSKAKAGFVYFFGNKKAEGKGLSKDILGGKGAGLAEMTSIGLPVPAGFTISIPACEQYYASGKKISKAIESEIKENIKKLEKVTVASLVDPDVSVEDIIQKF